MVQTVDRERLKADLAAIADGVIAGVPQLARLQGTIDALGPMLRGVGLAKGFDLRSSISTSLDALADLPDDDLRALMRLVAREALAIERPEAYEVPPVGQLTDRERAALAAAVAVLRD